MLYSGMGHSGTSNTVNIYNNNITGNTFTNATSVSVYFLYHTATCYNLNIYGNNITNNTLGGGPSATATGTFAAMYTFGASTLAGSTENVYNNNITGNQRIQSVSGGGTTYYMYNSASRLLTNIYNNTISNNTVSSTGTTYCIYNTAGPTYKNIYENTISNILNANGTLYGIYQTTGTNIEIYRNKIQNLNANASANTLYGIYVSSGTNALLYNNMISELKTPASTNNPAIYGMYISTPTTCGAYFNTIFLNATSTGASFGATGIYASTTPTVELRNNIVDNSSTPGATGRVVAYQRSSTTLTTYANTSNNNDFYAGTPGTGNLIFYDGTNSDQTMAAFQTRVAPRDASSFSEHPPFVNITASPYDIHLQTTVPTQCESGGSTVSTPVSVTKDYDGNFRYPNPGYPDNILSPATAPDVGADEFAGLTVDLSPPIITVSPLLNTPVTGNRTLTANIIDTKSGVPTSGIGLPRLYWKINSGAWNGVTATSLGGGQYQFVFGAGAVLNDVVSYYIVAQDLYTTPNLASSPSAGAAGFTPNPPAAGTPPTTPYSYLISNTPLIGDYTVGTAGNYTTLTTAVADLNTRGVGGAVRFLLLDANYASETLPLNININNVNKTTATNTFTIKPSTGVTAAISGAADAGRVFDIRDSYVTIDGSNTAGGTTRNLTITNTSTTTPQVVFAGSTGTTPLTNFTIKNCILINGVNSSSALVLTGTDGTGGYFNNTTIQNNSIQKAYIAIYFWAAAVSGNGSNLLITGNDLNTSGTESNRLVGVYVQGADGASVTNNNIGNMANTADASNMTGIWLATATINTVISGNTITNLSGTSTGPRGIAVSSGVANAGITVTGNNINTISTASSVAPYGIYVFSSTTGVSVTNNKVGGLLNSNTGGYGARGIHVNTGLAASNVSLVNNVVYDIKGTSDASLTYYLIGIGMEGATGGVSLYHNSVYLSGTYAGYTSATVSTALYVGTPNTALDIRDNIFVNTYDNTGSTTDKSYAVYCATTNAAFTTINYNNYFVSGTPGILGYLTTDQATLAAWQTATGQDVNSVNLDPQFVSASDLTPTNAALNNLGFYLTTVPTDINGAIRTNPPDMGAIEFGSDPLVNTTAATLVATASATLNGTVNASGFTVNTFFDYGLTTAYGTSTAAVPASVTGTTVTPISLGISGLLPITTYHYRARGVTTGGLTVYGPDMTFTTTGPPPTVVTTAATSITTTGATLNGTVNANGTSTTVTFEYGLTTSYGSTTSATPGTVNGSVVTPVSAGISGLTPSTLYHYRVKGSSSAGTSNGNDMTFTTAALPPVVVTNPASGIGMSTATLNGTVTANNASTTVTFQWGTTIAYGNTAPGVPSPVTGTSPTAVSANITGLVAGTTYHFRCVGVNSGGTTYGLDESFVAGCTLPSPAGAITGPTAVCASSTGIVYSVAPIPNATSYTWTVPAGAAITAGLGTNTITVMFAATSGNITVKGTNGCGDGTASSLAVTVNPLPTPTITGPATACQGTTLTYTTQTGMTAYTWAVSAGGQIVSGAGTSSITVKWNVTAAQWVSVNYTNATNCTAGTPFVYNVTVQSSPVPTITGINSICPNVGYVDYTTEGGFSNYIWTVSPGGMITSGQGTNVAQVTWTTAGAQWVAVNYSNASGCSAVTPTQYNVTVNPLPGPAGAITGTAAVCGGATGIGYSTTAITSATYYIWTLPAGATIASGAGTTSITVDFAPDATSGSITVTGNNLCGNGTPSAGFAVTVTPLPAAAGAISGDAAVCEGSTDHNYSVTPIANATGYNWTVPAGATITSGANTNAITVSYATGASSGNISVIGTNSCGNGSASPNFSVTVNPIPSTPTITVAGYDLTSSAPAGNQWVFEGNDIPGATAQTYTATQSGWYWVYVKLNGCSSDTSAHEYILIVGSGELAGTSVSVYPVPNDGQFRLTINSLKADTYYLEIFNNTGMKIFCVPSLEINGTYTSSIDLRPAAPGIYTLVLRNSEGQVVKKIVINR